MKKTRFSKILSLIVCSVLIAACALTAIGCGDSKDAQTPGTAVPEDAGTSLGKGAKRFNFTVVDVDGNAKTFEINTDQTIVGEALKELGLITGEPGQYGLYVKTVNGMSYDFDKDGKYWAFYVGEEYGMEGVDKTEITEGASYAFKVE